MRSTLYTFLLLGLTFLLACGSEATNSVPAPGNTVTSAPNTSAQTVPGNTVQTTPVSKAPAAVTKVVDMAALVGKTRDELKTSIKETPAHDTDTVISWNLPRGVLKATFTRGKQDEISFSFPTGKTRPTGSADFTTPEKIGDLVGIDLHGKTPASSKGESVDYGPMEIGGKKVKSLSVTKNFGVYNVLTIRQ